MKIGSICLSHLEAFSSIKFERSPMKPYVKNKNSDEVIIEIKESKGPSKGYWNLRDGQEYSYGQESTDKPDDEISIEFNLNESRDLTREQKQTILNTLLQETDVEPEPEFNELENLNLRRLFLLLILLIVLVGAATAFILVSRGC